MANQSINRQRVSGFGLCGLLVVALCVGCGEMEGDDLTVETNEEALKVTMYDCPPVTTKVRLSASCYKCCAFTKGALRPSCTYSPTCNYSTCIMHPPQYKTDPCLQLSCSVYYSIWRGWVWYCTYSNGSSETFSY